MKTRNQDNQRHPEGFSQAKPARQGKPSRDRKQARENKRNWIKSDRTWN